MSRAPVLSQALIERGKLPSAFSFVIPGPPRTKKNHGRRLKRGNRIYHVPSAAFEQWEKDAGYLLAIQKRRYADGEFPLPFRVNCAAVFYRDKDVGDAVGYYQALADCLEKYGIVKDDKQIVSWNGSEMRVDARGPRVEVTLEVL